MHQHDMKVFNGMKYIILKQRGLLVIKVSGKTRDNEPLLARRILSRYLRERGIRVILDLNEIGEGKPITLVSVLNSIRKKIGLLGGDMKLCSLGPTLLNHFKENRLDRLFSIYKDEQTARESLWRAHGEN